MTNVANGKPKMIVTSNGDKKVVVAKDNVNPDDTLEKSPNIGNVIPDVSPKLATVDGCK